MLVKGTKQLWTSPTLTTWGNQGIQAIRLLAVTPLILTQFDTSEIAAWYLFGSLMLFGTLLRARISLTFSRMISFAMGGASDLSPIKKAGSRGGGEPNWKTVERAYGTIGSINAVLTVASTLLAIWLGIYGLENIAEGHDQSSHLWWAFGIMVGSQSLIFFFERYAIALRGMNYIALINRWNIVFSLLSVVSGFVVLTLGANIWQLALTMQTVEILNIPRMRFLLRHVENKRFRRLSPYRLDRQIIGWAWDPVWKGFIVTSANTGMMSFAQIVYARYMPIEATASFVFTMRLLNTISATADAPFMSHMPRLSRLMAEGNVPLLREIAVAKITMSQYFLVLGCLLLAVVAEPALALIKSNADFLPLPLTLVLSGLLIAQNCLKLNLALSASGNHIICFFRVIVSATSSILLFIILIPLFGFWGVVIGLFPQFIALNLQPLFISAKKIDAQPFAFIFFTAILPFGFFALIAFAIVLILIN